MLKALFANAVFSAFTGSLMVGPNFWFGNLLGTPHFDILRIFGLLLLCHAAILVFIVRRGAAPNWVKLNLVLIAPYPALIFIAVLTGFVKGPEGITVAVLDGLIVGAIAIWQFRALKDRPEL